MDQPHERARELALRWQRGTPEDLRGMRRLREAHRDEPPPTFLSGPYASELCVAPDARDADEVALLLEGQYWTGAFTRERMARAQLGSSAWLVAREARSRGVLASARAVSDGARFAYVLDVVVRADLRRRGFGRALMSLLLAHPMLRDVLHVGLRTRDAQGLYHAFGFVTHAGLGEQMLLTRPASDARGASLPASKQP